MDRQARPLDPLLESIKKEVTDFVPNEAVKLVLDFSPANYTDLRIEPGGELMIHDPRIVPLEAALSYTLKPGKFYQFYVSQITTRSLKRPYASNCTDYFNEFWPKYAHQSVSDALFFPLSETVSFSLLAPSKLASLFWRHLLIKYFSLHSNVRKIVSLKITSMNQDAGLRRSLFGKRASFQIDCTTSPGVIE